MEPIPSPQVAVTYRREWNDGFGARGWKLDVAVDDPVVIAATAETGCRIHTSVLVHDILDHHLCGLPLSGHRNEAVALLMLAERTGSDPRPDFTQMVEEELIHGLVNGESYREFLPEELRRRLPKRMDDGPEAAHLLADKMGREGLKERLVERFFELGHAGWGAAREAWKESGLDFANRVALGAALQRLLTEADAELVERGVTTAHGRFHLGDRACSLELDHPDAHTYRAQVA